MTLIEGSTKLRYVIYNPNPVDISAEYIIKACIEANMQKVEAAIKKATEEYERENVCGE